MNDRSMRTFPIEHLTDPHGKGIVQIYADFWWVVSESEELYFYGTKRSPYLSPQCNRNRSIAEKVAESGLVNTLGNFKEVRLIPLVFVPVNINDFI